MIIKAVQSDNGLESSKHIGLFTALIVEELKQYFLVVGSVRFQAELATNLPLFMLLELLYFAAVKVFREDAHLEVLLVHH